MILIQKWLDGGRNFLTGRILYNQYGKDEGLKVLLAGGEKTPGAREGLLKALQALAAPAAELSKPKVNDGFSKMPGSNDPVCKAISENWKKHYTAMNLLRGRLDAYGTANSPETIAACNDICQQILCEERHINACWEKLRYYEQHQKLPEEKAEEPFEIPTDPVALGKLIESIKRNIRRNRQRAAAEPANALYPALQKKYEDQLKQIEDAKKN